MILNKGTTEGQTKMGLDLAEQTIETLKANKSKDLVSATPLLSWNNEPLIYPNTINMIQGKAGTHKSRLAETIASALIKTDECENGLISLQRTSDEKVTVFYVDTERNLTEQFPRSIQNMLIHAGYKKEDDPEELKYMSLIPTPRIARMAILKAKLAQLRKESSEHMVVILDVITDCITDFNNPEESMEIVDYMNEMINSENVTFIVQIHENPGWEHSKARGHLGTELLNKSSLVISLSSRGFELELESQVFTARNLKNRNNRIQLPRFMYYNEGASMLQLCPLDLSFNFSNAKTNEKGSLVEMVDTLKGLLTKEMSNKELAPLLMEKFGVVDKTIQKKLAAIISKGVEIVDESSGEILHLNKTRRGKEVYYSLQ